MNKRYILENKTAIAEPDLNKWEQWMSTAQRLIRSTDIEVTDKNRFFLKIAESGAVVKITTVFLGINCALAHERPILFETKISGGVFNHRRQWSRSWEEALDEHQFNVEAVKQAGFICHLINR